MNKLTKMRLAAVRDITTPDDMRDYLTFYKSFVDECDETGQLAKSYPHCGVLLQDMTTGKTVGGAGLADIISKNSKGEEKLAKLISHVFIEPSSRRKKIFSHAMNELSARYNRPVCISHPRTEAMESFCEKYEGKL